MSWACIETPQNSLQTLEMVMMTTEDALARAFAFMLDHEQWAMKFEERESRLHNQAGFYDARLF